MTDTPITQAERDELRDWLTWDTEPFLLARAQLVGLLAALEAAEATADILEKSRDLHAGLAAKGIVKCAEMKAERDALKAKLEAAEARADAAEELIAAARYDVGERSFLEDAQNILKECVAPYSCEQMQAVAKVLRQWRDKWAILLETLVRSNEERDDAEKVASATHEACANAISRLAAAQEEIAAMQADRDAALLILPACCGSLADAADTMRQELVLAEFERNAACEDLNDWRDSAKAAAAESCGDEKNCTCVGPLRKDLKDAKAAAINAFVQGADWLRFKLTESTSFESERDEAAKAAGERYPFIPRVHLEMLREAEAERDSLKAEIDMAQGEAEHAVGGPRESLLTAVRELGQERDSLKAKLAATEEERDTQATELVEERDEAKAKLAALVKAARPFANDQGCDGVHHAVEDRHDQRAACPIVARLQAALKAAGGEA